MGNLDRTFFAFAGSIACAAILAGCGAQPGTMGNLANSSSNTLSNISRNTNGNSNSASSTTGAVDAREPDQYQASVKVNVEATGTQQNLALPTLTATVARNADNRRMEFTMPAGGRVVFLDKGGTNYLLLPEKKQYAELTPEAVGFQVRRLLMPEQIVKQAKAVPGVQLVGEDKYNGRDVIKYKYAAVTNTSTQAGQVATDSFLLVDKDTGLPLHSETVSQSQSGANVQGYSGVRLITEITDIKTSTSPDLFDIPPDLQKIDSAQVRQQVDMVFGALAAFVTQMMNQSQSQPANTTSQSPVR